MLTLCNILTTGKVDPLAKDYKGKTPMYYATARGNYDLLKLFRCNQERLSRAHIHKAELDTARRSL